MTREEAITYAKRAVELGLNDETQAFCDMAIKALEQQTTRPTARWERLVDDFKKCSKCGRPVKFYRNYKYCPGCGSEMQEVEG